MARALNGAVVEQVRRLFGPDGTVAGLDEVQILQRYAARRDDAAFEALVRRHGPMVLHVCRQLLREPQDVEDAFQATFLVLVRKAGTIRRPERLGNWLYGVAYRVASKARVEAARRRRHEEQASATAEAITMSTPQDPDLAPVLHEELHRLPEKYRVPIILCYLEGRTQDDAARLLGWPVGTVKGRLSRARETLRRRLDRRGMSLPLTTLTALLTRDVAASILPPALLHSTVKSAALFAVGGTALAGVVPVSTVSLAEGVIQTMFLTKLKVVAALIVAGSVAATGAGVHAIQDRGTAEAATPETEVTTAQAPDTEKAPSPADPFQEPVAEDGFGLPGGTAGAGTGLTPPPDPWESDPVKTAPPESRLDAARQRLEAARAFFEVGTISIDRYTDASLGLMETERALAETPGDELDAVRGHVERMEDLVERESRRHIVGSGSLPDLMDARYALAVAVEKMEEIKMGAEGTGGGAGPGSITDDYQPGGQDARSRAIVARLARPIDISFRVETPLEEAIAVVQQATADEDHSNGIPIYIDPIALEALALTLQSPIVLDLEGVPLRTTLRLMLRQLGLVYAVVDGVLIVSTPEELDEFLFFGPMYDVEHAQGRYLMGGTSAPVGGGMMGRGGGMGMGGYGGEYGMMPGMMGHPGSSQEARPERGGSGKEAVKKADRP